MRVGRAQSGSSLMVGSNPQSKYFDHYFNTRTIFSSSQDPVRYFFLQIQILNSLQKKSNMVQKSLPSPSYSYQSPFWEACAPTALVNGTVTLGSVFHSHWKFLLGGCPTSPLTLISSGNALVLKGKLAEMTKDKFGIIFNLISMIKVTFLFPVSWEQLLSILTARSHLHISK